MARIGHLRGRPPWAPRAAPRTPEEDPLPCDQTRATLLAFVAAVGAADAIFTALATGRLIRVRAAVAAFIRTFYEDAFAARGRVDLAPFDAHGRLVIDLRLAGTHVGAIMDIPATGRRIAVRRRLACGARGGEVVAITGHLPIDQFLAQLRPRDAAWHGGHPGLRGGPRRARIRILGRGARVPPATRARRRVRGARRAAAGACGVQDGRASGCTAAATTTRSARRLRPP
jgi:hypothetical protein